MFTGIVTDIGTVCLVTRDNGMQARIKTSYDTSGIDIGASIACNGVCLTVTQLGQDSFDVDISEETLSKSNLSDWAKNTKINLERALRIGDELGGHIVSGHVDGVAEIISIQKDGPSTRVTLKAPQELARFIAPKGSVALNGVSLTVNDISGTEFGINMIPHTKSVTTWGHVTIGDMVNLEIDTLARYVSRLTESS